MQSNVPRPSFGDKGFVAPSEAAILAGVQADLNTAFGTPLDPSPSTPQGQIAATETAIIGDNYATFLLFCNQVDPALNSERMQDAIGRIYYMQRIAGSPTVVQATCSGLVDVVIPVGAIAKAQDGNLYLCQNEGKILASGSVVLPFACAVNGPIPAPADSVGWTIYQAVFGWDSVTTLADGVLGRDVENRSEFEARRNASVAKNAQGILDAIQGQVLAVPGVLDCYATENDTSAVVTKGGVLLAPNSLYVAALGGSAQAVAEAIWSRKAPGCGYNGNTTMTVVDPSPNYSSPVPTYTVSFEIPPLVGFAVQVVLRNSVGVPSNARTLIQTAVVAAFAGTDGGPRARIGSIVFASRFYAGVALLGPWAQIIDIQVGLTGQAAAFTGSIAATTLTVSAISAGALAAGQLIQDATANVKSGTTIVAQLTGAAGGVGTYSISDTQTVASEAMDATTLINDIALNINQAPSILAAHVQVSLQ